MTMRLNESLTSARALSGLGYAAALCLLPLTGQAETRGYVISWFATATNSTEFKANCPENRNGKSNDWRARELIAAGYSPEEAKKFVATVTPPEASLRVATRAIVNGKNVSIYNYPEAVASPNIETVTGKFAYGFDLGGNPANKFIDPETSEKVDNQLWRAVGCTETFNAVPPIMPYPEGDSWGSVIDQDPGWALQVSGADLSKDGPVTLTLSLTTQHLERNATGGVLENASYIVDYSPRSYNLLKGQIKDGMLRIEPSFIRLRDDLSRY